MLTRLLIVVAAIALSTLPIPALEPPEIERWYSTGIYPALQDALTASSNNVPFALFDVLLAGVAAWLLWQVLDVFSERGRRLSLVARLALNIITACAVFYLAFLAAWGLNYRRVPLKEKLIFDAQRITPGRARALAETTVERLNALYEEAHKGSPGLQGSPIIDGVDPALSAAFLDAQRLLGVSRPARAARPKRSLLNPYFHAAGVDGMTDPYFLETLIPSDLLPFEQPLIVAHEWSHLAGFADESEANFVGWLACVHGPPHLEYSAWLFLYGQVVGGLGRTARTEVTARLDEGPRTDLRAIAERVQRQTKPLVATAGWRVYDQYLKVNRITAGTASYAQVVQLILGTQFSGEWRPGVRPPP